MYLNSLILINIYAIINASCSFRVVDPPSFRWTFTCIFFFYGFVFDSHPYSLEKSLLCFSYVLLVLHPLTLILT